MSRFFYLSIFLSFSTFLYAENYNNSWQINIKCNGEHKTPYVFEVIDNKFSGLGTYWVEKDLKIKGFIKNDKIKISFKADSKTSDSYIIRLSGKIVDENEYTLKGSNAWGRGSCKGKFMKVNKRSSFAKFEYIEKAIIKDIEFDSYDAVAGFTIIDKSYLNLPIKISGKLYLPHEGDNFPAIVFNHGSGGPYEYTNLNESWRNKFRNEMLKNNIALFEIDSFTGRGTKNTHRNQGKVSAYANTIDVLHAYKFLNNHPKINGKRLGVTGHSRGGIGAWLAVEKRFTDVIIGKDNYYKISIPMAPDCSMGGFENPKTTLTKTIFILGLSDDYTIPETCIDYAKKMKDAKGDVELILKEGWYHDFYSDTPPKKIKAVTFRECYDTFPVWDLNDDGYTSETSAKLIKNFLKVDIDILEKKLAEAANKKDLKKSNKILMKLYKKLYKYCGDFNVTVGGNHGQETYDIITPIFLKSLKN